MEPVEEVKGHDRKHEQRTPENDRSSFFPDIRFFDDCRHHSDGCCYRIESGDLPSLSSHLLPCLRADCRPFSKDRDSKKREAPLRSVRKSHSQFLLNVFAVRECPGIPKRVSPAIM